MNNIPHNLNILLTGGDVQPETIPVLPRTADIQPVNQRQERQRFFQRFFQRGSQFFQSLRAYSGRQVLGQVDTAVVLPLTPEQPSVPETLPVSETLNLTLLPPPVLPPIPAVLALSAIEQLLPSFAEESPLHVQMGQFILSQTFQDYIDNILFRYTQGSHSVPQSEQYITDMRLLRLNSNFSRASHGGGRAYVD